MSRTNLGNSTDLAIFNPAAHYHSPDDVLGDTLLSDAEKRIILSSWASDMFAVESCPWLRDIPGMSHTVRLADILAALRQLDGDDDPPPRGGLAMRLRRPHRAAGITAFHHDDDCSLIHRGCGTPRQFATSRPRAEQKRRKNSSPEELLRRINPVP